MKAGIDQRDRFRSHVTMTVHTEIKDGGRLNTLVSCYDLL